MELATVMYHYILGDEDREFRGVHHLPLRDFKSQIEKILKTHEPLGVEGAVDFLSGKRWKKSKKPVVFTFDDGLRCHHENVYPFFRKKGIPGLFFVITTTLSEGKIPFVHKTHILRSRLGDHGLKDHFLGALGREMGSFDLNGIAPLEKASKNYRWDSPEIRQFKYLINFVLSDDIRENVMGALFAKFFNDTDRLVNRFFMNKEQILEMANNGMEIGGHSHQHKVLTRLSKKHRRGDVEKCLSILEDVLNRKIKSFSYPFGRAETFDKVVIQTLQSSGVICAFSTIVGGNPPGTDHFAMKRIDAKDIK